MSNNSPSTCPGSASSERLAQIRSEINEIDEKLLRLFNARASLSLEVGKVKATEPGIIFKPKREHEIIEALIAKNEGPLPDDHLRIFWREIMSSSRALQRPQNVAYLGPEGTFSYFAGLEHLGHTASFHPCSDITQIFEEVSGGQCELGIVPLENSLQGTVGISFDLFLKFDVLIQAEIFSRISHCLLSNTETLTEISTVYSHPQPLAQCGAWLRSHLPNAAFIPVESTAAAAHRAAKEQNSAAIGHARLAEILDLNILARRIEDVADNWTRFVIIGPKLAGNKPKNTHSSLDGECLKTSLLFTLQDAPGALSSVLNLFASHGINMRKLESRPLRGQNWKYAFFADIESNLDNSTHNSLISELAKICTSFRILGSYPAGQQFNSHINEEKH